MALRSRNKISAAFSMSGMTDIVFLLLIFFMITSTLIHPTALKLLLPQSSHQTSAKPLTTVSITGDLQFYVEDQKVDFNDLERVLQEIMGNNPDAYVSIHCDRSVDVDYLVKVLSITQNNGYKVILATTPE